jgi:hypothetical protein
MLFFWVMARSPVLFGLSCREEGGFAFYCCCWVGLSAMGGGRVSGNGSCGLHGEGLSHELLGEVFWVGFGPVHWMGYCLGL